MAEVQSATQFAPLKKMIAANGDILAAEQEGGDNNFSGLVDSFLSVVEKSGLPEGFTWADAKPILIVKFDEVTKKYEAERSIASLPPVPNVDNYTFDEYRTRILEHLNAFEDAPFTLGRICELLRDPRKHYDRGDKFFRAFEKCVMVTSTNGGSETATNGSFANGHTENGNGHANGNGHTNGDTPMETDEHVNGNDKAAESKGHHVDGISTNGTTSTTNEETGEVATATEADSTVTAVEEKVADSTNVAVTSSSDTTATSEKTIAPVVEDAAAPAEVTENVAVAEDKETLKRPNEDEEHDTVAKKIARIENGSLNGGSTHAVVGEPEVEPHQEAEVKKIEEATAAAEMKTDGDTATEQEAVV